MTTILCVEDETAIRQDIVEELQDAGYATLEAGNGEEGLAAIRDHNPDLVLCDITMPRMDGHKLVKHVRMNYPQFSELPFLFLSALADRKDVLSGIELGADDYLTKPIDFELLLTKVEATLRWVARMRQHKEKEQIKLYKSLLRSGTPAPTQPAKQPLREAPASTEHRATALEEGLKKTFMQGETGSAGRLHFINLAQIRETMGDDWERQAAKVMTIAENVIDRHLTKGSICNRQKADAFILMLPDLGEEEATVLVETIADEIAIKLLGENYRAYRHLSLTATAESMKDVTDGGRNVTQAALAAAFEQRAAQASSDDVHKVDMISRMLQRLAVGYQPVWNRKSERVFAYHADPQLPSSWDGYGNDEDAGYAAANPIAVDIDAHLLSWLAGHLTKCGSGGSWPMTIVPISYQTLVGDNGKRLTEAFQGIAKSGLSKLVMIEITAIPDSANEEDFQQALGMPREFSHPLIVRGSPDRKFVPWARKAGAAFLSLHVETNADEGNRQQNDRRNDRRIKNFADGARALGVQPYIHGLNTMGGVKQALSAEVSILAGSAFGRVLDLPGETYGLREKRLLIG
jgi:CheY-like chemotaxis protein